jgi:hypothetical protein
MAIPNYVRPQLTIAEVLQVLTPGTVDRLTPIAIGPQYLLNRYGKETTPGETFLAAGKTLTYQYVDANGATQGLPSTHTVDLDSVKVYGENLEAELAFFNAGSATHPIEVQSLSAPHILRIDKGETSGYADFAGDDLDSVFAGRDVAVGDLVYVNDGNRTVKRTVTGLRGRPVASSFGTNTAKTNEQPSNSAYNPDELAAPSPGFYSIAAPAAWSFQVVTRTNFNLNVLGGSVLNTAQGLLSGEEYTFTVQTGGTAASGNVRVNISSKSGLYSATNVAVVNASGGSPTGTAGDFQIANAALAGAVIDIRGPGGAAAVMTAGQVFKIQVLAPYERLVTVGGSGTASLAITGDYTGARDTTYLIKVKTGTTGDVSDGAVVEISDTAGIDEVSEITLDTDGTAELLGTYGLSFEFDVTDTTGELAQGGLRAGDVYYVHALAESASTTSFNGIVLDGPAVDTSLFNDATDELLVRFRVGYTGEITSGMAADGEAWTADADGITLDANVALEIPARDDSPGDEWVPFVDATSAMPPVKTGKVYASYRALVPAPSSQDRILIETVSDIVDELGTIDLDNDLAFGANEMLSGANGKAIYALRTAGTTLANYTAALRKIESTDRVYALCPLTDDLEIQQAVTSHCESMSSAEVKQFRRCYVASDSPGSYAVLKPAVGASNYTATVSDYNGEGNLLVTTLDDVDFELLDLGAGDRFLLTGASDTEFEIAEVLSSTELLLTSGPTSPISPAEPFELWRADTPDSQIDYIIQRSRALNSRRAINVWVEDGTRLIGGVSTRIPSRFIAAEVAGLRCAVLPQQGLSMTEIQSVTDAPAMFIRYTRTELDRAAAEGVFIVTQEADSGTVFIRHQLTTDSNNGSLYYEDSAGVNLDDLAFKLKDVLAGYIGKKNVTQDTLVDIYNDVWTVLNTATKTDRNVDYGPQLNGFDEPVVEADSILKDRVNVYARVEIPLPLNVLAVTLEGSVDFDL